MEVSASGKPRVLVFGGGGQLGKSLAAAGPKWGTALELVVMDRKSADIADADAVRVAFETVQPRLVINAAAYTSVDGAETDGAAAFAGNAIGPHHLATACAKVDIPFFHVSTDYVFSGTNDRPWRVDDAVAPANAYGRSKLAGEWAVQAAHPNPFIFRTSWVFSPWGNNFVKTMLRLGRDRDELGVINDQHGCPTYAPDLADALLNVASDLLDGRIHQAGIYHYSNQSPTTWFDFANAIFETGAKFGHRSPRVRPISTAEYPTPALRPAWSVMDLEPCKLGLGLEIPTWMDALERCFQQLQQED